MMRYLVVLLYSLPLWSACHVVTPGGAGATTGADWNNAYQGLPSSLVRGDTYYLSDGSYSAYTFNTAVSGTTAITIKKATVSDHCTETGWNLSTMGNWQAIFSGASTTGVAIYVRSSYLIIDGGGRSTLNSGYGIKLNGLACTAAGYSCYTFTVGDTVQVHDITAHYVEFQGAGANAPANLNNPDQVISVRPQSNYNLTFRYNYIHDSSGDPIELTGGTHDVSIYGNYIYDNKSSATNHGEGMAMQSGVSNVWFYNNIMQDIEGTAYIDAINAGSGTFTFDNINIWNNIFFATSGNAKGRSVSPGAIVCAPNGQTHNCTNWRVYNNVFANINCPDLGSSTGVVFWAGGGTLNGSADVRNNIWYSNCKAPGNSVNGGTLAYNSCLGPADNGGCSGTGAVNSTATTPIPFVNWTASPPALPDFSLASDNSNWNNRISLGSPYDTDANGAAFTSSRGAFQYAAAAGTPPTITTTSLPNGSIGVAYSQTLVATGDMPITWSVLTGSLPLWASLTQATGAITGTPDTVATTTFTVRAGNASGTNDKALSITVDALKPGGAILAGPATLAGPVTRH